jgi:sulfite exporter TauE/SafE
MELWTALILGLAGSLHCAGMCGPLALAIPATGDGRISFVTGRLAYNLGRIITYCTMGAVFGLVGLSFELAGFQRWASILAGVAILLGMAASTRHAAKTPLARGVAFAKSKLALLLRRRTLGSVFLLGILNGFLPCGLVYAACANAVAAGGVLGGIESMAAFGIGTVPMMLGIGLAGKLVQVNLRLRFQRWIPAGLTLLAVLFILRGLSLGIPYVSPDLSGTPGHASCCH